MLNQGRVLLGAFSDLERAVEFVGRVSTTAEDVVRARWPDARRAFVDAPAIHPEPAPPLDESVRAEVEEVLRAPLFASSLATKRWRIEAIAVDALAVAQPLVNLTRVETISTRVRASIVEAFFPLTTSIDVTTESGNGAVSFLSSRGELTVSSASMRRMDGDGAIEVTFRVEPRPNYVSALDDERRLVLRNGHHRVAAAWGLGVRTIPCVVIDGSIEVLAARMASALDVVVLRRARPPLLRDLASPSQMTLDVALRPKRHALRLSARHDVSY